MWVAVQEREAYWDTTNKQTKLKLLTRYWWAGLSVIAAVLGVKNHWISCYIWESENKTFSFFFYCHWYKFSCLQSINYSDLFFIFSIVTKSIHNSDWFILMNGFCMTTKDINLFFFFKTDSLNITHYTCLFSVALFFKSLELPFTSIAVRVNLLHIAGCRSIWNNYSSVSSLAIFIWIPLKRRDWDGDREREIIISVLFFRPNKVRD